VHSRRRLPRVGTGAPELERPFSTWGRSKKPFELDLRWGRVVMQRLDMNQPKTSAFTGYSSDRRPLVTRQSAEYPLDYSKTNDPKDQLGEMVDTASNTLKAAADGAQALAGKVTEQAREYGNKAQEAAKEFKPYVEKSVRDQPMQTLAIAGVVGFVLGALWKK
jgi:ElaB/YqjD/DUF883 family membrane-anchored ribosome-binding protein